MKTDPGPSDALYLPDFCTSRATLATVLIVELTALVLTLARQSATIDFWTDLARTSMFLLWIGLAGSALLCVLRARLVHMTVAAGSTAVLGLISAVIAAVSLCAWLFGRTSLVIESGGAGLFPTTPGVFVPRNVGIGLIVTGLALRYFYVAHEWRRSSAPRCGARACAAGAHPATLPVQQHEYHRRADAQQSAARGGCGAGPRGSVPCFARRQGRHHHAGGGAGGGAHLSTHGAAAPRRAPAGGMEDRLAPGQCARARPHDPAAARECDLPRHRAARRGRHGHHQRGSLGRAHHHRGAQPARPGPGSPRGQPPGARQHPRAAQPAIRRARTHEVGALRRRVHRDLALPAHREAGTP